MSSTWSIAQIPPRCSPPRESTARAHVDGLEILVAQGALSFELWTGREAPLEVMRRAVRMLGRRRATPHSRGEASRHDERGPQRTGPDLHAIFGIDSERGSREPEHTVEDRSATDRDRRIVRSSRVEELEQRRGGRSRLWRSIHAAGTRASSGRASPAPRAGAPRRAFSTDVIVDLGLVSREQVESAIETSRATGTMPERVLLDSGALTQDGLTRALAERYGLDHLDLGVFSVDMNAANLVSSTAAKRYQAVPVAFADKTHAAGGDGRSIERAGGRRHRDHDRATRCASRSRRRRTSPT